MVHSWYLGGMSERGEAELSFRGNSLFDPIHIYPFIDLFIYHCVYSVCAGTYLCLGRRFRLPLGQSLRDADDAVSLGRIERRLVNRPVTGAGWGLLRPRNPFQRQPQAIPAKPGQHWPHTGHRPPPDTTARPGRRRADQSRAEHRQTRHYCCCYYLTDTTDIRAHTKTPDNRRPSPLQTSPP
jgi:hypothetical protein